MYESFFDFQDRPFLPMPRADRYYAAGGIENARQTLARSIQRGEGPALLIGPAGTGKTLLCHVLAREFQDTMAVAQMSGARLGTRAALLQAIHYELRLPYRALDEGELRLSLVDFLAPGDEGTAALLLLVDEAHTLPLRVLEEIRMITNLVRDGQPRVRVVLSGSPVLEERFASPKLSAFAQRLAARCYLEPLDAAETSAYVRSQIVAVGGNPARLIDDQVLRAIYRATDGIPRLINQVCDHALLLASVGGHDRLSSEAIEEAWADLQQLPTLWSASAPQTTAGGVVEFGQLDDAADELPEAIPFRSSDTHNLHLARTEEPLDADEAAAQGQAEPQSTVLGGTEVDLDFPEFGDPLAEQFEEEEVVLDRYASDVEIFADVPRVTSWEGRRLASMLEPLDVPPPRMPAESPFSVKFEPVELQPPVEFGPLSTYAAEVAYAGPGEFATTEAAPVEGSLANSPPADVSPAEVPASDVGGRAIGAPVKPAPPTSFWAGASAASDDAELIIIEHDVAPPVPQPPRKREYRQLFAKLRRG